MRPVEYAIKLSYSRFQTYIYHDEGTLTGSECVFSEDTDTVMKLKAQ